MGIEPTMKVLQTSALPLGYVAVGSDCPGFETCGVPRGLAAAWQWLSPKRGCHILLGAMYPFERFTDSAKQLLTLAQQEAENSSHSYIGTELILLAMTRQSRTIASEALGRVGVTHDEVRERIDAVLGRGERILIQQIIPTSRVKTVIEMAFAEAQRLDSRVVGTDHVLVAIALEGQNVAAHVLVAMGATVDALRTTIAAVKDSGVTEPSGGTARAGEPAASPSGSSPASPIVNLIVAAARAEAASDAVSQYSMEHVLHAIVKLHNERIKRVLASLDIDEALLIAALTPPQALQSLRRSLHDAAQAKHDAVAREDYKAAESFRITEELLGSEVEKAEREWDSGNP